MFIVVTKIDMCPPNILEQTIKQLEKILKSSGCRKAPLFVNDMPDVFLALDRFVSSRTCPIFQISNVTGQNLDLLKVFLNLLNYSNTKYDTEGMVEFQITETFSVPGVGTVVCGGLASGRVTVGDTLLLGPDSTGAFIPTMIKSIQRKRVPTNLVLAGQTCSFALKKVKRTSIRKGMVLVSSSGQPRAVQRFQAELLILFHSTTISERYQAMLHCNGVRQTAKIIHMDRDILRTGDRALVTFEFISHPEFLIEGSKLLIREGLRVNPGRTKGLGKVVKLLV